MSMNSSANDAGYTRGMGFLPPLAVTPANMISNVPASTLLPWSAATTYAEKAEVIDPTTGVIYMSLTAGNLNKPLTDATKWQPRGVEERLRMFDSSLGSVTENDELIEVVITPGRVVTDVVLIDVQAHTVQVVMTDPVEGVVRDTGEVLMLRPSGNSHWGYFFHPIERETKLHVSGLPAYTQATVTIRIKNPGGKARCAEAVIGRAIWLGNTQWRPSIGFDDWGLKKRDAWGGWMVEKGATSDRLKLQVQIEGTQYGRTRDLIRQHSSKPVVWFGARGYNVLTTLGYITSFEQVLVSHGISDCNMTIEGLEQ